jgi:hypothetical protein
MIELIRVPSKQLAHARPEYRARLRKYDYTTPDGRWYVQEYRGCRGGWEIIDTTGEYAACSCCWKNSSGHIATRRTLDAAKAFISEWSA